MRDLLVGVLLVATCVIPATIAVPIAAPTKLEDYHEEVRNKLGGSGFDWVHNCGVKNSVRKALLFS